MPMIGFLHGLHRVTGGCLETARRWKGGAAYALKYVAYMVTGQDPEAGCFRLSLPQLAAPPPSGVKNSRQRMGGSCLGDFSPPECAAYLANAGYRQPYRIML